jgi:hypothetical protein
VKVLELIEELQSYYEEYGNIEVCIENQGRCGDWIWEPLEDVYKDGDKIKIN